MTKLKSNGPKCPAWFEYFVQNQFLPLVQKVDKIEENQRKDHARIVAIENRLSKIEVNQRQDHAAIVAIENRLNNLVKVNNLKE